MVGGPLKMSYQLVPLQKGGGTLLILALCQHQILSSSISIDTIALSY